MDCRDAKNRGRSGIRDGTWVSCLQQLGGWWRKLEVHTFGAYGGCPRKTARNRLKQVRKSLFKSITLVERG